VRFYTEHFTPDGLFYKGTSVAYERSISQFTTISGDLVDQLTDVFVGSSHVTLGESVLRKEVVFGISNGFPTTNSLGQNVIMRSHAVDANTQADLLIQLLNDDTTVFQNWGGAPYFIPSGATAAEIEAADPSAYAVLVQTEATNPDGSNIPLLLENAPGSSDIATLYNSIQNGFISNGITGGAGNDIPGGLEGADGIVAGFTGDSGLAVAGSGGNVLYDLGAAGTVQAWIYVEQHSAWAGIVHKGSETDFSDEAYSLQFWGGLGNVAFCIVQQGPYAYRCATSTLRLNTGKWYYVVGTYDATNVNVYIFGNGLAPNPAVTTVSNNLGVPAVTTGPVVIGAQFTDGFGATGFYGAFGQINGVGVLDGTATTVGDLTTFYTANEFKTALWPSP
jgi:hypothetical protein